jgi:hypothetical protein
MGYGEAIRSGMKSSKRPIVAMCDGDGTYDLAVLPAMIQQVREGKVAVGCRFRSRPSGMSAVRYVGNSVLSTLLRLSGIEVVDSQSGLKVFPRSLGGVLAENGMTFSTEILIRARLAGIAISEVETKGYNSRRNGSVSKLRAGRDGLKILVFILKESFRVSKK